MGQIRDERLLKQIALRLKGLREEKELSQEEVYNKTDIHIGRIESAKVNISVSTLFKLCRFYGTSLAEFFADI